MRLGRLQEFSVEAVCYCATSDNFVFLLLCSEILLRAHDDAALDAQLKAIAAAHHGKVTLFAHNLRTGQTAAVMPDEPVQTASR